MTPATARRAKLRRETPPLPSEPHAAKMSGATSTSHIAFYNLKHNIALDATAVLGPACAARAGERKLSV